MSTAKKLFFAFGTLLTLGVLTSLILSSRLPGLLQWLLLFACLVISAITAGVVGSWILRTERVLHQERERFKITLASIGDAVVATDADGRITFLNSMAKGLIGCHDDAMGLPLSEVIAIRRDPLAMPSAADDSSDCPATGECPATQNGSLAKTAHPAILVAKDGSEIPIEDSAAPIRDDGGRICGVVLTLRDARLARRAERRRRARVAITEALTQATTRDELAQAVLRTLGEAQTWDAGALWLVDSACGCLRCLAAWSRTGISVPRFLAMTRDTAFASGVGLPGRVWASGQSTWIVDVTRDANFPRGPSAAREGLHAAFAFPLVVGREVLGVVEFFSKDIRQPDEDLLEMTRTIGSQLGLFFERKRTEDALRASEERARRQERELADFFENAVIPLQWVAPDGTILRANRAQLELLGCPTDEYIGRSVACFHLDGDVVRGVLEKMQAGETPKNFEARLRCKNDAIKDVVIDMSAYRLEDKLVHCCWFTRDVTDRKRAEEAASESEERFRSLAHRVPMLIWMTDRDNHFEFVNQAWLEYTGRPLEQEVGRGWLEGIHADDHARCCETYTRAFAAREKLEMEFRLRRSDGTYRWLFAVGVPRFTRLHSFAGYIGSCIDITERKQAEEDQKRMVESLGEADRRKDEFLAILSHELRNPLAPIRNALHLLRLARLDDPEVADARAVIDRQVHQLSGIVDDLLDVFRITHQKMKLYKEPLDLARLVRLTAEDHRRPLEANRIHLELEVPGEPVWVCADRTRMVQILSNLLYNAAKFTNPHDEIVVELRVEDDPKRARLSVRDTGIGIAPDMLERVFETFSQGDRSLDRPRGGGLGLGLALVKGLVELHGGRVSAYSEGLGKGTEISFWLPVTAPPSQKQPEASTVPVIRPLRVLIVEDNRDTAQTLKVLLSRHGHQVHVAHNGKDGVDTARQWLPEVVLCDLGLPEMNGYEVATALRAEPATANLRLIAVSGYGQDEDRQRSEEAGYDLHLTKPVDPVDLLRLLAVLKIGS